MTAAGTSGASGAGLAAVDVSFAYAERDVLRSVSLTVEAGRVVGVLGPNGSGKTTLLRCLLGVRTPRSGRVTLDGRNIDEIPRREFARRVAAVSQEMPVDFPLRVLELVLLGRLPHLPAQGLGFERAEDLAAAEAALRACGVDHLAERPIHELSGGELRRAFVARAVAQGAGTLLLDEPTGGLDLRHQVAIVGLLRAQARAGVAVLAVLHDLNLAAMACDQVVVLKEGSVAAAGPPRQVLDAALLAEVYGVDVDIQCGPDGGLRYLLASPR